MTHLNHIKAISPIESADFGSYTCVFENSLGSVHNLVTLKQDKRGRLDYKSIKTRLKLKIKSLCQCRRLKNILEQLNLTKMELQHGFYHYTLLLLY